MPIILWPLAITNAGTADAAKADATACLFWVTLICLCHLLQICNGANILPALHIFPNAPDDAALVPDPFTLGILATALPGCQLYAECCIPASVFTPLACNLFLATLSWTNLTISYLIGAFITFAILIVFLTTNYSFSFKLNTDKVGLQVIINK